MLKYEHFCAMAYYEKSESAHPRGKRANISDGIVDRGKSVICI